jgi:hypothetical protein
MNKKAQFAVTTHKSFKDLKTINIIRINVCMLFRIKGKTEFIQAEK